MAAGALRNQTITRKPSSTFDAAPKSRVSLQNILLVYHLQATFGTRSGFREKYTMGKCIGIAPNHARMRQNRGLGAGTYLQ